MDYNNNDEEAPQKETLSNLEPMGDDDINTFIKKIQPHIPVSMAFSDSPNTYSGIREHEVLFFFLNKDMEDKKVGHWMILITPENCYFDSLNLTAAEIKSRFIIDDVFFQQYVALMDHRIQKKKWNTCGYWACFFLYLFNKRIGEARSARVVVVV